jgi:iron complex outermembrane receptor protein
VRIAPEQAHIFNAFAQDELTLTPALKLTLGARVEYEDVGGWGVSPSARVIWEPTPRQRVWAAVARARRTPAAIDRTLRVNIGTVPSPGPPVLVAVIGNPEFGIETLTQLDAGCRLRIGSTASLDLAVFRGRDDDLTTYEPQTPMFEGTPAPAHVVAARSPPTC